MIRTIRARAASRLAGPILLAGLVAALALGAACKRDRAGGSGGAAAGAAGGDGAAKGKPVRIAMIGKSSSNPVFLSARAGAEVAARELGASTGVPIEVVWLTPPQEDGQIQAQRIAQAVSEGATAILVSCSDAATVTAAIDDAVERGVPVMTFDSDAPGSKRFSYYGVDDRRLGGDVMGELVKLVGGRGKVAVLTGNQDAPNLRRRVEAARDVAGKHGGLQVVGVFHTVETPQDAAAEVIRVHGLYPDIKGWAMVGGWALFTKTLLTDLDPRKVKMVAVDALPPELPYVEKGLAPVLLAQSSYLWGSVGVAKIVDKVVHKRAVPALIPMDPVKVTRGNLGAWSRQLKQWGFADVPEEYLKLD